MTSTAWPVAPAQPFPSARLLWPESAVSHPRKILALVRLVGPEQGAPAAVAGQ